MGKNGGGSCEGHGRRHGAKSAMEMLWEKGQGRSIQGSMQRGNRLLAVSTQ